MSFRRRALVTAALTANAIHPLPGFRAGVPSFLAGWLTGELAPQLMTLTATDVAVQVARGRRDPVALAAAGGALAGLTHLVVASRKVRDQVEEALVEGLGVDYVEQLDAPPTPAELATPWRKLVNPFDLRDPRVHVRRDIPYSDAGRRGHLDIYTPVDTDRLHRAPVLLQVHGGGWTIGRKDQQGIPLMQHLAAQGWVCVAINYRLAPRDLFPAHIIDVKRAIAWIRDNIADHGGDPDYVVITGGSAGGHLAALAALTPGDPELQPGFEEADTSVVAAIPHYGVYDFAGATGLRRSEQLRDLFLARRVIGRTWTEAPEVFEKASPILRITPDAPDFFVIHGAHDTLVPVEQARLFVQELRRVSRRSVVYAELPGAQHAFDIFPSIRSSHVVRGIDRYLNWHWNTWRQGLAPDVAADPAVDADEVASG